MEKLIELFKQHKRETGASYEYILFRDNDAGLQARCIDDGKEIYIVRQAEILSKKMGFIKWLVEKGKIDFSNIKRIILNYEVEDNKAIEYYDLDFATKEETLLMLLSIQDNPIEFLVSILK